MKPLVVLPTYNEASNLPQIVPAILAQGPFHILIVDDNSPDGTGRLAEELRQPGQLAYVSCCRGTLAALEGRFDEAEELAARTFEAARRAFGSVADVWVRIQRFAVLRARGRLEEILDLLERSLGDFPTYSVFRCVLAHAYNEAGREGEARSLLAELGRAGFPVAPLEERVYGLSLLADVASGLGDRSAAGRLYELLLPHAGRAAVSPPDDCTGSIDRPLGLLATTLERWDEAEGHFRRAVEVNERIGARPWAAHARHDHARMLLARDGPGDRERALELLATCLRTCRELGMVALEGRCASLLDELGEAPTRVEAAPSGPPARRTSVFRREGEYWSIVFERETFRLRDAKGLRYLSILLASPGKEIHVLDLVAAEGGVEPAGRAAGAEDLPAGGPGDAGEVLDPQAREAYRRRLVELEEELEEARAFGDAERAARAEEERDFLARELASAMGLGGRSRVAASASERARVNVTRAIRSSLARIGEHSPALGRHLEAAVRTGTFCSYCPDPLAPIDWRL